MLKNIYQSTPLHKDFGSHCVITQEPTAKSCTSEGMTNFWFSLNHTPIQGKNKENENDCCVTLFVLHLQALHETLNVVGCCISKAKVSK
jgi:hypothetical protein